MGLTISTRGEIFARILGDDRISEEERDNSSALVDLGDVVMAPAIDASLGKIVEGLFSNPSENLGELSSDRGEEL